MAAALSPDPAAPLLVTGGGSGAVRVWDVRNGQPLFPLAEHKGVTRAAHTDDVWTVAFSPDGKLFATGSRDETVKVWDAARLQVVQTLESWDGPSHEPGPPAPGQRGRVRS